MQTPQPCPLNSLEWTPSHATSLALLLNRSLCLFPSCHSESRNLPQTHLVLFHIALFTLDSITNLYFLLLFIACFPRAKLASASPGDMEPAVCSSGKMSPFWSIAFYDEMVSSLVNHFLLELSELYWCCLTIHQGKEYSVRERKRREWKRVRCQEENHADTSFSRNNHRIPSLHAALKYGQQFSSFWYTGSGVNKLWGFFLGGDPQKIFREFRKVKIISKIMIFDFWIHWSSPVATWYVI